jgi:hypothetical protein
VARKRAELTAAEQRLFEAEDAVQASKEAIDAAAVPFPVVLRRAG